VRRPRHPASRNAGADSGFRVAGRRHRPGPDGGDVDARHPSRAHRPPRGAHALGNLARTFSEGFAVAREPRDLAIAFVWSFPLWVSIAFQVWLVTRAFGILIPVSASFLIQAMLVIGVAVPTPGAVGSFHEAYRIAVTTFFHAPNSAA